MSRARRPREAAVAHEASRRRRRGAGPALGARLRAAAPVDPAAAGRAHEAAMAAFAVRPAAAAGELTRRRRRRRGARALLAAVVVALLGAIVLSPAGARVGDWIGRTLDPPPTRPAAVLPGEGPLLISGRDGSWTLDRALRPAHLGEFTEAAWSARGNYLLLNRGDALFARDRDGTTRWSLARSAINRVAWSPDDGYRVAYRSGRELRIVAGDGSGDRLLAARSAPVTPAWQPGPPGRHTLAWARPDGAVVLSDVDMAPPAAGAGTTRGGGTSAAGALAAGAAAVPGARLLLAGTAPEPPHVSATGSRPAVAQRYPAGSRVEALAWVGPRRLLVLRGGGLLLLDDHGRVRARLRKPDRGRFSALATAPAARTAAFVRRAPHGTSVVWSVRFGARSRAADASGAGAGHAGGVRATSGSGPGLLGGAPARIAFAGSGGAIRSLALSADGRWLAFVWPPSDQLLLQRLAGRPRLLTVDRLAGRLGHLGGSSGTHVVGWAR